MHLIGVDEYGDTWAYALLIWDPGPVQRPQGANARWSPTPDSCWLVDGGIRVDLRT